MEDGPLSLDDGTNEVQRLLVEPQDQHVSMDSVLCFNEKIPENAMKIEEVSCSFVGPNYGVAQGGDVPKQEVLNVMPSEVETGYFQLHNDFCGIGEDYFSGIEFAQSITNLDYGLSEGLHISFPTPSSDSNTPWKSDLLAITNIPDCQNDHVNAPNSDLSDICIRQDHETSVEDKKFPTSSSQNLHQLQNTSSHSPQHNSSDEDGGSLSPSDATSGELFCSSKNQKNKKLGQNAESHSPSEVANLVTAKQKRSRKPTRRYIDELAEPIVKHSKKRQEVSSSAPSAKTPVVKNRKKCHIEAKTKISLEESSVVAIQVPFGSLVNKECQKSHSSNMVIGSDNENSVNESEDMWVAASVPQKRRSSYVSAPCEKKCNDSVAAELLSQKKRDDRVTAVSQKKRDDCVTAVSEKKRDDRVTPLSHKKRDDRVTPVSQKKRDDSVTAVSQKKRDDCMTPVGQKKRADYDSVSPKKRDDHVTAVREPEVNGRRKHHRLWTISEVRKLIDGVSQYGVGRWSRIKKLLFSTSPHRTSVDLKDKWRNLLKASGIQEQGTRQGEKKRNLAWRPLPKPILRRVCELATIYPYPNGRKPKITQSDKSTDITLSDYRRILRSINGS